MSSNFTACTSISVTPCYFPLPSDTLPTTRLRDATTSPRESQSWTSPTSCQWPCDCSELPAGHALTSFRSRAVNLATAVFMVLGGVANFFPLGM